MWILWAIFLLNFAKDRNNIRNSRRVVNEKPDSYQVLLDFDSKEKKNKLI